MHIWFADEVVGPYWLPEIRLNRDAYRELALPFGRLPWPELHAEAHLRLGDLCRCMRTWSASQAYERGRGTEPFDVMRDKLTRAWGDPQPAHLARWPLRGAIGRVRGGCGGARAGGG